MSVNLEEDCEGKRIIFGSTAKSAATVSFLIFRSSGITGSATFFTMGFG